MSAELAVGLTLVAAELALIALVVGGLAWSVRRDRRANEREWAAIAAVVEAARRDHTPLIDRIAADMADELFRDLEQLP